MKWLGIIGLVLAAGPGRAEPPPKALFALILGVNRGLDPELPRLRYADDDAARSLELFRALGARTYLLTRVDEDTRRLHPQAAAEAALPVEKELERVLAQMSGDIAQARERNVPTALYVLYAGHGNIKDGEGYIALEDGRLTGKRIAREIIDRLRADESHLIVDACYSFFLAFGRGPGGARRPLHAFAQIEEVLPADRVGLLFSTSSARESHEWQAYQAGIFSHEVRSGLYGAADANGDGRVSYREIAAFIERANGAIANERFRPDVYARPPARTGELIDLRGALGRRLEIDGQHAAHYTLEDERGVKLAELHNAEGQAVALWRPAASGLLFLRRASDDREYVVGASPDVVELARLEAQPAREGARGAAALAFGDLFTLGFDENAVEKYAFRPLQPPLDWPDPSRPARRRTIAGIATLAGGVALAGVALGLVLEGNAIASGVSASAPEATAAQRSALANRYQWSGDALFGVAGAAVVAGATLLGLSRSPISVAASARGGGISLEWNH
jgi:hypothetical protein